MDVRPTATFDDFMKMDLRVARVLEAGRVPKSKSSSARSWILGLKNDKFSPASLVIFHPSLVGKQVIVVANLAPQKMMGLESQG